MKSKKTIDDVVEISEYDYFVNIFEPDNKKLVLWKIKEFDMCREQGFNIYFYYNKTKNYSFYQLYQTRKADYKS